MIYVKTAIIVVLIGIGILLGFMFATFDANYELKVALDSFLKEEYGKSEVTLNKLEHAIPSLNFHLYQAYISRAKNGLSKSNEHLIEAIASADEGSPIATQLEVYLNQCFNAFLTKDFAFLSATLQQAEAKFHSDDWLTFFKGIKSYYVDDNFSEALMYWSSSSGKLPFSTWMKKAFGEVFTPLWEKLHLTRCHIEQGDYLHARQTLEQQNLQGSPEELSDVNVLIGITYMKEAEEKPIKAATPYYKLAFSYFSNVPFLHNRYLTERTRITEQVSHVAFKLLETQSYRDLPFYASLLGTLRAKKELNTLTTRLITVLDEQIAAKQWIPVQNLTVLLNRLVDDDKARQQLSERFETLLVRFLEEERTDLLNYYWEVARLFNKTPEEFIKKISQLTMTKTLEVIADDDSAFTKTLAYLTFLQSIEGHSENLAFVTHELVNVAGDLWLIEGEEQKALNLMKMAVSLTPATQRQALKDSIKQTIVSIHEKALKCDELEKLPFLLDAVRDLQLQNVNIDDQANINNHLKIAAALFNKEEYDKAKKRITWILYLMPQNQQARFLDGMISYYQGNYSEAFDALKQLENPPTTAEEAIAICQYLAGDQQWGQQKLELLAIEGTLGRESYLRLGYALLQKNEPSKAMLWFNKISPVDNEVLAGLAFVAYQQQDWETVVNIIDQLSGSYKNIAELQALAALSLCHMELLEQAEKRLLLAMQQSSEIDSLSFSTPFMLFRETLLAFMEPHYVAAKFFSEKKQDQTTALKYLLELTTPNVAMLTERGKLLLAEGKVHQAIEDFEHIIEMSDDRTTKISVLPLLAIASQRIGHDLEAYQYFSEYFSLVPNSTLYYEDYALTLINLRHYDLALNQFLMLRKATTLPTHLYSAYVNCLIRTDHTEEAIQQTRIWLKDKDATDQSCQLDLLQQMIIPKANGIIFAVLKRMPASKDLNISEKINLANLFYHLGKISKAHDILSPIEEELKQYPNGLEALVHIYHGLSNFDKALALAHKTLKLNPFSMQLTEFIYQNERDPLVYQQRLQELQAFRKQDHMASTEVLVYARKLTNLARGNDRTPVINSNDLYVELREAYFILDKLAEKYPQIPEIFFLLGEVQFFTNHLQEAREAYHRAISLDPTYSAALRALGSLYRRLDDFIEAIRMLSDATKYQPSNAEAWEELANLYILRKDYYEAKLALYNTIKFKPNDGIGYVKLAKVLIELKNPEDAKMILERAVKLDAQNIEALKLLLACLYDDSIGGKSLQSNIQLRDQKVSVYQQIYAIDPKEAEEFAKKLDTEAPSIKEQQLHHHLVK